MKKRISIALVLIMLLSALAGCTEVPPNDNSDLGETGYNTDTSEDVSAVSNTNDTKETGDTKDTENDNKDTNADTSKTAETAQMQTAPPVEVDFEQIGTDMFTDRDSETNYDESDAIIIQFDGNSAKTSDNSVKVNGSTITITEDATHIISGTLDDGMIIVDAPDTAKLQIVLNGVNITSSTSAPIYIKEADKVFITLVGENTLSSGESYVAIDDSNIDAAIYSKQDLTLNGNGTLNVNSPAGHGIISKDDLVFTSGTYNIAAASHAIDANDSVRIKAAVITADAGKDGIHAENNDDASKGFVYIESGTLKIECEGDGISSGSYMQIEGGTIDILAGGGYENGTKQSSSGWGGFGGGFGGGGRPGGRAGGYDGIAGTTSTSAATDTTDSTSMKGLKSGNSMLINGGNITANTADDAIHSNLSATINGGTFALASGDDGIHAEDTLTVTAGNITITESYEGLEALHIDMRGGDITLKASDDGLNAAGGTDESGTTGGRDGMFGGKGGFGGWGSGNSNGSIKVSGGTLYINMSGDGMDANGTLEITGGHITVVGPTSGDTAVLDYDKTGTISGGTFIGSGSSMMAQSLDGDGQGVIAISVGSQSAETTVTISDRDGNELLSHTPELSYQIFIYSSPEIKSGETYTITVGSQSGEVTAS